MIINTNETTNILELMAKRTIAAAAFTLLAYAVDAQVIAHGSPKLQLKANIENGNLNVRWINEATHCS